MVSNLPEWQFVEVAGQTLRYWRTGGDKAPLVLVHGFTDGAVVWKSLMPDLSAEYDVIAYDGRGHGGSVRVQKPYSFYDLTQELLGLLAALKIPKAGMIGHSMGAAIAYMAAAQAPECVDFLVLEDPPFTLEPPLSSRNLSEWKMVTQMLQSQGAEAVYRLYRDQQFPTWSAEDVQTRVEARMALDIGVFDYMDWQNAPRWQDFAPKLRCAGLLLCGDVSAGAIVTPDVAQMAAELWHGLKVVYISGTGHHIRCGQPHKYAEALGEFLAEQERR